MEDSVESDGKSEDSGISSGVVFLIALVSIGGLMIVSWIGSDASVTGSAVVKAPYATCCTAQPWGTYAPGYRQGYAQSWTALCDARERPPSCCIRSGKERFMSPVSLLGSSPGTCESATPDIVYPYGQYSLNMYTACCTIKKWGGGPTGIIQSEGITTTQACNPRETPFECCARSGYEQTGSTIRVSGARLGSCNPPETTYPAPAPVGGYPACCTTQNWQQSPTGFAQSEARSTTQYCDQLETPNQCCLRIFGAPIKLLGATYGTCSAPVLEQYYPIWVR
ncbi:MAG: hypothetical protein QW165_01740 [Candidatus Woesearchaeota archaeon]